MRGVCAVAFGLLGLVITAQIAGFELERAKPAMLVRTVEYALMILCIATAAITGLWWALGRRAPNRAGVVVLLIAALVSGFLFFSSRGLARHHYAKWYDGFHYVLGAKYFDEVGYLGFYDCAAAAFVENQPRFAHGRWKVRDLATYKLIDARDAIERGRCAERFSPERWAEFRRDIELFHGPGHIPSLLRDHGYNGSPFHTFFASKLAGVFELSYASVTLLAVIDVLAICAMMALVVWGFGARLGLLFAILFFVNFSDRFFFIGGSMMRYLWMATLVGGVAGLARGRYRLAGVLMTCAALLNIFPVLFLVGVGFRALWTLVRQRVVPPHHRRFVAAAALTGVIGLGIGAAHSGGVDNYTEFFSFIGGHSQKLTSSRTGLRYTVIYRGQSKRTEPRVSYKKKARDLRAAAPFLFALGALLIGGALVASLRLDDAAAAALVGFVLFYVLFGTVEYYYACAPMLLLVFHQRWRPVGGAVIAAAFAAMAVVLYLWRETRFLKFCNNTAMSAALLSVIAMALVALLFERRLRGRTLVAALVCAAASGPAVVAASTWWFSGR